MEAKKDDLLIARAAQWYARLGAVNCTKAERRACDAWRAASVDNEAAFSAAERAAARVSRAIEIDAQLKAMTERALATPAAEVAARPALHWRVAAAVGVIAVALGLAIGPQLARREHAVVATTYRNETRQPQLVTLRDGTNVRLDVGGVMRAAVGTHERDVELLAGRAYFEVVHDATRPFEVKAGNVRTLDLGTKFQIEMSGNAIGVTLAEGAIAVSSGSRSDSWSQTLSPGERLQVATTTGEHVRGAVDAAALTSWSQGRLVFRGTPLAQALDELNRYASTKIHLGDDALAAIPIGGNFVAGADSAQVVEALAAILPIRAVRMGPDEIVLFQRYESARP